MQRRISRAIISVVFVAATIVSMAAPASAAPFSCDVAGLIQIDGDIPMTASGPATLAVGETASYGLEINLANVIPEEFSFLQGTANSAVVSVKLPQGAEIDAAGASVSGVAGATFAIDGDAMVVTLPGPIAFGGDVRLPLVAVSFGMKATQAGTITLTTEGTSAVVDAVAAIAPGTNPIPATATCTAAAPETLLTVTASEVASATQTAGGTQTQTASGTAAPATGATTATAASTAADPSLATTGADSITITGMALLMLGFGMLAVAGQRVIAFRDR
jgi:hypothetical protein